jgi:hypothetical protein
MDPDVVLARALESARAILDSSAWGADTELAEDFLALDEWLAKGGFAPARWRGTDGTTTPAPERRTGWGAPVDPDRAAAERGYREARELRAAGDHEGARDAEAVALRRDPDNRP